MKPLWTVAFIFFAITCEASVFKVEVQHPKRAAVVTKFNNSDCRIEGTAGWKRLSASKCKLLSDLGKALPPATKLSFPVPHNVPKLIVTRSSDRWTAALVDPTTCDKNGKCTTPLPDPVRAFAIAVLEESGL